MYDPSIHIYPHIHAWFFSCGQVILRCLSDVSLQHALHLLSTMERSELQTDARRFCDDFFSTCDSGCLQICTPIKTTPNRKLIEGFSATIVPE